MMKLVIKDYWQIAFSLEKLPISDGPVEVLLAVMFPNGYRCERPSLPPITVSTRLDVYDLYQELDGEHTVTHSSRQFLECSPTRPIHIDEDRVVRPFQAFHG